MILWAEQNAKGKGDDALTLEEKKVLLQNPKSETVIIFNPLDKKLISIFMQIPWEYGPMGNVVGKKYEAIKDYLEWNELSVKEFTPLFVAMGEAFTRAEK